MKKPAEQRTWGRRTFQPEETAGTKAQRLDLFSVFRGEARRLVWLEWSCVLPLEPPVSRTWLRDFPLHICTYMSDI